MTGNGGLRRSTRHPVRIVHLGLGAFHRAHQAWYTQRANELGDGWGIEAFTGRSAAAALALSAQDNVYLLIERGPEFDTATLIESISAVGDGAEVELWRRGLADPAVGIVTLTITEQGYRLTAAGAFDAEDPEILADIESMRSGGGAATAPARLVDGLRARRAAGAGPIALVSCDNLPNNGSVARIGVLNIARRLDPGLADWIENSVSFVSTMVDRITPATTAADVAKAFDLTGLRDAVPVVTEPFSEWVLSGDFPAGRPAWDRVGARFVDDIAPFERRKLWLLNAAHSSLAYHGMLRGRATIAEAMLDPDCRSEVELLWREARAVLPFGDKEIDEALAALRSRFSNARIEHRLVQIGAGGSQKLGPRILDPVRRRREMGLPAGEAQIGVLAAWAMHLMTADRRDPATDRLVSDAADAPPRDRARALLEFLAPDLVEVLTAPVARRIGDWDTSPGIGALNPEGITP